MSDTGSRGTKPATAAHRGTLPLRYTVPQVRIKSPTLTLMAIRADSPARVQKKGSRVEAVGAAVLYSTCQGSSAPGHGKHDSTRR